MSNTEPEFNSCAKLLDAKKIKEAKDQYNEDLKNNVDVFAKMLSMQKSLQAELYAKNPAIQNVYNLHNETLGNIHTWMTDSKVAFDDEFREIIDALAGMNKPPKDRSALWKKWKKNYATLRAEKFSDLSENEQIELKFEVCDAFHFFMNMMLGVNMSAEDMYIYYMYKNKENFERIKRGY